MASEIEDQIATYFGWVEQRSGAELRPPAPAPIVEIARPPRRHRRWWPGVGLVAAAAAAVSLFVVIDRPSNEPDGPVGPTVTAAPTVPSTPVTTAASPTTSNSTTPSTSVVTTVATPPGPATTPPTAVSDDVLSIDLPPYAFPMEGFGPCAPPDCPVIAAAPDGNFVAYDPASNSFSIQEYPPRTVTLIGPLGGSGPLIIGPDEVAYLVVPASQEDPVGEMVVVSLAGDNAGRVIARPPVSIDLSGDSDLVPTANGLVVVGCCGAPGETARPDPAAEVIVPWIDRSGAPITDDRPQVRLELAGSALEVVRADTGQRWTVPELTGWMRGMPLTAARIDGGAVIAFYDVESGDQRVYVFEPSGTVERLDVSQSVVAISGFPEVVLFDGETFLRGNLPTYTDPVAATDDVARWLDGAGPTFTSADEVIDTIVANLQDSNGCENPSTATEVDRSDGDPTTVTIDHRSSCDDSVAGSLIDLSIGSDDAGAWTVVHATQRYLCLRGAAGPDVCV